MNDFDIFAFITTAFYTPILAVWLAVFGDDVLSTAIVLLVIANLLAGLALSIRKLLPTR